MRDYNKDGNLIPDSTDTDTKDHVPDMEKEVSDVISGLDFKEMVSDNREDASSDLKENITVPDTDTEDDTDVDTNGYADGLASEYLMPEANIRVYEKWEIADYDLTLTQRAINELYARHGYIFKEADVKQYFMGKSWYEPRFETIDPKTDFSDCEYKNYLLLVEQRDELK